MGARDRKKVKLEISKCLKDFNAKYHRAYTLQDLAEKIGVNRETLSRASSESSFAFVYQVVRGIYELYSAEEDIIWDFGFFMEKLLWENHDFNMGIIR